MRAEGVREEAEPLSITGEGALSPAWGGAVSTQNFGAPSFDDKKLEVVAVFGSIQMAVSRVINLQHHRIAQVGPGGAPQGATLCQPRCQPCLPRSAAW